jgi:hypothetical protein
LDVAFFRPLKIAWRKVLADWKEKGAGRRLPSVPKNEFPTLLATLMNKIHDNACENLKSGFRKTGIFPVDKNQVLSRLPHSDNIPSGTGDLVSQSFIDHLRQARGDDNTSCTARIKRRRVAVAPGKSLSSDDVAVASKPMSSTKVANTCPEGPAAQNQPFKGRARKTTTASSGSTVICDDEDSSLGSDTETEWRCNSSDSNTGTDVEPDHENVGAMSVAKPKVQKGRKRGQSSILTKATEKNALAEAQRNKKKQADPSAKKKNINKLAKNGSTRPANSKGKKPASKKCGPTTRKKSPSQKDSNLDKNSTKTVCLVCSESCDEDWVQCLECKEWAHDSCTDGNDYYVCHNCDDLH